jgi:hypothetical protein
MHRASVTFAVLFVLLPATPLRAQDAAKMFEDVEKEAAWTDVFDGATIDNLQIGGVFSIKDGVLILGGGRQTRLQIKTPLGDEFKLLLECRFDGPAKPSVRLATRSFLAHGESGMSMTGTAGEWQELLYIRKKDVGRGTFAMDTLSRKVGDKAIQSAGGIGGSGTPTLSWEVPAGTTLTIRKMRLQTNAPVNSSGGLYGALIVLTLVILGIAGLGWFLNRRRSSQPAG